MDRGQELVAVAQVILAELSGRIAVDLEQLRDQDLPCAGRALRRQADLGQAGAQAGLASDERRPAGRAALLAIVSVNIMPSLAMRSMLGVR